MQVPSSAQVSSPTVVVDTGATAARGFSPEVRSDVPPVQQPEGVRYTRGRPSDNDTYTGLYSPRKRSMPGETPVTSTSSQSKEAVGDQADGDDAISETPERSAGASTASELTPEDQALIEQLQQLDREVRLHEMAHQAVGGAFTGSASYEYRRGPDGKNYAVGGEVSVDVSPANSPEATIEKARQIRAAALAQAEPSAQDRQVAREAEQMIADAQQELRIQAQAEAKSKREPQGADEDEADKASSQAEEKGASASPDADKKVVAKANTETSSVSESDSKEKASTADESTGEKSVDKKDKMTPREALEKILLAGQSLTVQAGVAGYTRPDAPAGDSGLLDVVI